MGRPARRGGHTSCSRGSLGCLWAGGGTRREMGTAWGHVQLPVWTGPLPGGLSDPRACPALSPGQAWRAPAPTLGGGSVTNIWTQSGSMSCGVLGQV